MKTIVNLEQLQEIGYRLGTLLRGGECIELIGDVGTGKTTLTKQIARGMQVDEDVQSPSFTISRTYPARDGLELHHYDFYRLETAGIMRHEIAESIDDPRVVTVVEWGGSVNDVLPEERIVIQLTHDGEATREFDMSVPDRYDYLQEQTT